MSYAVGRRFEYAIKDKLSAAGFGVTRVPLSGMQRANVINADLVVEGGVYGKLKTTKAKKYVSFPEKEIMELSSGEQDFLAFNYSRTPPFVVIRFEDFLELLRVWKDTGKTVEKLKEKEKKT